MKHRYISGFTAIGVALIYAWFLAASQHQIAFGWLDSVVTIVAPIVLVIGGTYMLAMAHKPLFPAYRFALLTLTSMYALIGANELVNGVAFARYLASALAWSQVAWTVYVACLPNGGSENATA